MFKSIPHMQMDTDALHGFAKVLLLPPQTSIDSIYICTMLKPSYVRTSYLELAGTFIELLLVYRYLSVYKVTLLKLRHYICMYSRVRSTYAKLVMYIYRINSSASYI